MMPLEDCIGDFATDSEDPGGSYTVTRRVGDSYDADGYLVRGASTTFPIDAAVQPILPRDLRVLPEGQRSEDSRVVFTTTPLRTRDRTAAPDVVTIVDDDGSRTDYVCYSSQDWESPDGRFHRVVVARRSVP